MASEGKKKIPEEAVGRGTPAAASSKPQDPRPMGELELLIRARYPLIYVLSWEEQRVLSYVAKVAARLDKKMFEWSTTTGLVPSGTSLQSRKNRDSATQDPLAALDNVMDLVDPALYVFKDFHPFLVRQKMAVVRRLREVAVCLKNTYKTILLVSPILEIPPELEKDLTVIDFEMPKREDFEALLNRVIEEVKANPKLNVKLDEKIKEEIVHALLGLTLAEGENVLAKTLVQQRGLSEKSVEIILGEKKQIIRKSGLLEYYDSEESLETVGGLDALKTWLRKRSLAFSSNAREYGLPPPRGVLLLGVQGCGKSLVAKAVSHLWHIPVLRFDVGRLFGSLMGSSEQNVRRAIKVAESVAPTVLWIDEIDKAFRGSRDSGASADGGTGARVFGTLLTWLSEKKAAVFVVATANDISQLPPELLRKGRFDEIFFVDLPSTVERKEIFRVHLGKRKQDPQEFDLEELVRHSGGFSGAEIEESITSALFDTFYEKKEMSTAGLLASLRETVPLSKTMSEEIEGLRRWAEGRARVATSQTSAESYRKME